MATRGGKFRKNRSHKSDAGAAAMVDRLAQFEEFQQQVLPLLRQDLATGLSAEEIYTKYQNLAAARNVTIALTEVDSGKALAAIRDILDRSQGKAKERVEVTTKLQKLPDDQLDALLMSKAKDLGLTQADEDTPLKSKIKH